MVVTSHSASILRRVLPTEIRHFRIDDANGHRIAGITLPEDRDDAFKYVAQAVQSHPELYFASFIVLCEGASEQVVLPRVANAFGLDVDPRFVAVVPLGGRHVHHFWRLLREIGTPFCTLLDLDNERAHGGIARVVSVVSELASFGEDVEDLDVVGTLGVDPNSITADLAEIQEALGSLEERHGVFFSAALDLDFALLYAFTEQYKCVSGSGPRVPTEPTKRAERLARAVTAVLGAEGGTGATYTDDELDLFPWYSYLFLQSSKPSVHAAAFATLTDPQIREKCPSVLRRVAEYAKVRVSE